MAAAQTQSVNCSSLDARHLPRSRRSRSKRAPHYHMHAALPYARPTTTCTPHYMHAHDTRGPPQPTQTNGEQPTRARG